ncbi:DMT family transporter [Bacillus sp. AFS017336]|uniref:DMT family transporter n=1 Tax=Bacillus sp. AFS017336 TaxID=2033489 RepID=UPI000BF1EF5C|nr:DMT family transporter [Bacillus sp. AFS017336]PEK99486.1 EamA family transporter [Bacillus sp. AFS017336]
MSKKQPNAMMSLLILSIVAISTSAILAKWTDASPSVLSMYRLWFTCIWMLPFVLKRKNELKALKKSHYRSFALGGLMLAIHFILWYGSLVFTSVASSTIILALQPLVAMILGYFVFKERTSMQSKICMIIAIIGVCLIGFGDIGLSMSAFKGDILSFLSVIAAVLYLMVGQTTVKNTSHWVYSFWVFAFSAAFLTIYNIVTMDNFFDYQSKDWIIFIASAIIPSLAHIINNYLLNYVNATTISMSILGEPVGASILAVFLLHEMLSSFQLIGGTIVILSVFLYLYQQQKEVSSIQVKSDNSSSA